MCNREGDSIFSIAVCGSGEGLFRRILRHFSRSSGCPGVERQFSRNCECSRAPGVPESPGVSLPGDSTPGLCQSALVTCSGKTLVSLPCAPHGCVPDGSSSFRSGALLPLPTKKLDGGRAGRSRTLRRRAGLSGTLRRTSISCRSCRSSMCLCRSWGGGTGSGPLASALDDLVIAVPVIFLDRIPQRCPRRRRGEQNSWWKCPRSYPTLLSRSGLPSRSSTFLFLMIVVAGAVMEAFKVSLKDRVQQRAVEQNSSTFRSRTMSRSQGRSPD